MTNKRLVKRISRKCSGIELMEIAFKLEDAMKKVDSNRLVESLSFHELIKLHNEVSFCDDIITQACNIALHMKKQGRKPPCPGATGSKSN